MLYKCFYCRQRFESEDARDDHILAGHRDDPFRGEPVWTDKDQRKAEERARELAGEEEEGR